MCEKVEKKFVSLPGTVLELLTELPSGGLSPTILGSWALGGGEYTDGLGPCSGSNFFGTLMSRMGGINGRHLGIRGKRNADR